jgi:hypothetical protein
MARDALDQSDPISTVSDPAFLQPLVREHLADPTAVVENISVRPLAGGTSGQALSLVTVTLAACGETVDLVLKQCAAVPPVEVLFYRSLVPKVPVSVPRPLWTALATETDRAAWVLMEKVAVVGSGPWTASAYHAAIEDVARLHALYWGRTEMLTMPWLWRPDQPAITTAATMASAIDLVHTSWVQQALPDILTDACLAAIEQTLPRWGALVDDLLSLGVTLVHGDLWWRNIMLLPDGRRTFIDWGACRIFAGIWDLAYFIDLLRAVWHGEYRILPVPEERLVSWYQEALRTYGVEPSHADFRRAYSAARVLEPLEQWFGQLAEIALDEPFDIHPATRRHRAGVFNRWQRNAREMGLL